jgi:hypothetical protein
MTSVHYIPILLLRNPQIGEVLQAIQDTSVIIDFVETKLHEVVSLSPKLTASPSLYNTASVHPTGPKQRFVSYLLEHWADEYLKFPAMHYRWSFLDVNQKYLVHEWGRVMAPSLPASERDEMVLTQQKGVSFSAMKGSLPFLGITEATAPEIEKEFLWLLDSLETHFRSFPFLLGHRPSLADFALMALCMPTSTATPTPPPSSAPVPLPSASGSIE